MTTGTGATAGSGDRAEPPGVRPALAAERAATLEQMAGLEREFSDIVTAGQAPTSDDEHDPEGATIAYERQHVVALLEQARAHLAAIDDALTRLDEGGYGRRGACG